MAQGHISLSGLSEPELS
jgi:hypothetical protein